MVLEALQITSRNHTIMQAGKKTRIAYFLLFVYIANLSINLLPALNLFQQDYIYKRVCFIKSGQNKLAFELPKQVIKSILTKTTEGKQEKKKIDFCSSKDFHQPVNGAYSLSESFIPNPIAFLETRVLCSPAGLDPPPPMPS